MSDKYTLEIINREDSRQFKKYDIEGQQTIGVYENEPFIIKFRNNTSSKVQVRISVDGTDVLTGKLAHTNPTADGMWVVQGYSSMELKAWPENNEGGAEFLFGKTKDSVAANTHGDLSAKGLIAVAVFEESFKPVRIQGFKQEQWYEPFSSPFKSADNRRYGSGGSSYYGSGGGTYSSNVMRGVSNNISDADGAVDYIEEDYSRSVKSCDASLSYKPGPAVGAGDYVQQSITKTAGLTAPILGCIVQVKYEWWTSLRSKIRIQEVAEKKEFAAFPGNKENFINLGGTPRLETNHGRKNRIRREFVEKKDFSLKNKRKLGQNHVDYNRFV